MSLISYIDTKYSYNYYIFTDDETQVVRQLVKKATIQNLDSDQLSLLPKSCPALSIISRCLNGFSSMGTIKREHRQTTKICVPD